MFNSLAIFATLACSALLVRADPNPNSPGPGDVYNEGASCPIGWDADTTGTWKTMNIELMTGSNLGMVHLTTVATVDGTDATNNTFSWTCPQVTPNSAIYFYQFTSPASKTTMWTTRFAIADATGATVPPANAKQPAPGNQAIPWGTGALSNPSDAKPAPGTSGSSSTTGGSTSASVSAPSTSASQSVVSSSSSSAAATSPSTTPKSGTGSTAGTSAGTTGTTTGSSSGAAGTASAANGAMSTLSVDQRLFQTVLALGVAAAGFVTLL